ncbi:Netrin Receptor Dcc [Manis pentadactyla]|nr:Netrin Receptor Dcc [Manis pentadactyla]
MQEGSNHELEQWWGIYQDNLEGAYQSQLNSISQSRRSLIILNRALIWITKMPPEMYGQRVAQRTMTYRSLLRGQEATANLGSYQAPLRAPKQQEAPPPPLDHMGKLAQWLLFYCLQVHAAVGSLLNVPFILNGEIW